MKDGTSTPQVDDIRNIAVLTAKAKMMEVCIFKNHIMNVKIQFEISSEQDIVFEKNKVSSVMVADSEDSGLG
jgi:hypothetical protein